MAAAKMDDLFSEFGCQQKDLVHILHRIQSEFGYISPQAVARISDHLNLSPNEIYGVLTFYKAFRLKPPGRHLVMVCAGTACHVRDGAMVREEVERQLGIEAGETTRDRRFSLETVHCFGCCAIGPTIVVDGKYYSRVSVKHVAHILDEYRASA